MKKRRVMTKDFPKNATCPIMACVYNKGMGACDSQLAPTKPDASCYNVPNWFILQMMEGSEELVTGAELAMWPESN